MESRDGVPHLALLHCPASEPIRTGGALVCTEPNGAGTGAVFLRTTPDRACTGTDRGCTSLLLRCTGEDPGRTDSGPVRTGVDLIRTGSEPVRTRAISIRTGAGWICMAGGEREEGAGAVRGALACRCTVLQASILHRLLALLIEDEAVDGGVRE